jgi:hypothetical protein
VGTKKLKLISLIRTSRQNQADGDRFGITRQLEDIATICERENAEVVAEYRFEN